MTNRLDSDPIRLSGVRIKPSEIVGMTRKYRFENGFTTRVEIGTEIRLTNGAVFVVTETLEEIGVLLQGHDDVGERYTGGGDTDFYDPTER